MTAEGTRVCHSAAQSPGCLSPSLPQTCGLQRSETSQFFKKDIPLPPVFLLVECEAVRDPCGGDPLFVFSSCGGVSSIMPPVSIDPCTQIHMYHFLIRTRRKNDYITTPSVLLKALSWDPKGRCKHLLSIRPPTRKLFLRSLERQVN